MSKLSALGHFFIKVGAVAPAILAVSPLAPIAGIVQAAISEAQAIHGDTNGQAKLAHVLAIAHDAGEAINAQAGHQVVDVSQVDATAASVVSSVISAAKIAPPVPGAPATSPTTSPGTPATV